MTSKSQLLFSGIAIASLAIFPMKVLAQEKQQYFPKLFHLNKSISVGLQGGGLQSLHYGAVGLNTTIYGAYVDFMFFPRSGTTSGNNNLQLEHSVLSTHFGYQVPFFQYKGCSVRLIPMVGYAFINEYATYNTSVDASASTFDKISVSEVKGGFDYGAAFAFQGKDSRIGAYDFYIGVTRYTAWIGFAWEIQKWHQK